MKKKTWNWLSASLICKTLFQKFLFWTDILNLKTVERKGKKLQNVEYLKKERSFEEVLKTIFSNFLSGSVPHYILV